MDSWQESVSYWLSLLGTLSGLFGALQSLTWIAVAGVLLAVGSLGILFYAHKQHRLVRSALLEIENRTLDSLGMANLLRRINKTLAIQAVRNVAVIDGEDLTVTWHCTGYCQAKRATSIEFSVSADANVPFEALACSAFDLVHDPERRHPIRPMLMGPDGIAKRIAVPFLAPLSENDPFEVVLTCELPGCMNTGTDYYAATLSFAQDLVPRLAVELTFRNGVPRWVRVYERRLDGGVMLLKQLQAVRADGRTSEYHDMASDVAARSARVYVFSRKAEKERTPSGAGNRNRHLPQGSHRAA
jgi:hypothetical protein